MGFGFKQPLVGGGGGGEEEETRFNQAFMF